MKTSTALITSTLFTLLSLNNSLAGPTIDNIKWLLGTWESQTSRGPIYETWVLESPTELSGKSYAIKEGDTLVFETVRLSEENGKFFYIPSVANQNNGAAIVFESSFISPSKFIVENPKHDYPKVISYTRIGENELVAEISGPTKTKPINYQTFAMKRIPDVISKNLELVKAVFVFFNEHNWEQMAGLYTNPAEFKDPFFGTEPVMQSHTEIIEKYQEMNNRSTDIQDKVLNIYPSGEKHVIVEFISSGTNLNGTKWKLPLVTIFTIENNAIVKDFSYYDK